MYKKQFFTTPCCLSGRLPPFQLSVKIRLLSFAVVSMNLIGSAIGTTTTTMTTTTEDCSCIDSEKLFEQIWNCNTTVTGEKGIIFNKPPACFPISYGSSSCAAHDLIGNHLCQPLDDGSNSSLLNLPEFCFSQWCFVNGETCKRTHVEYHRSTFVDAYPYFDHPMFYSYSLCNFTNDFWKQFVSARSTEGKTLTVTMPAMWPPFHYKTSSDDGSIITNSSGPEYYNDDHPWEGVFIDYFNSVVEVSNLAGVKYTYRSVSSDDLTPSPYSAAVFDIQRGLTDLTLSSFWVTSERLSLVTFTQPLYMDRVELFVKQPGMDGLSMMKNAVKLLNPFTRSLWIIVFSLLFLVSAIHLWFAASNDRQDDLLRLLRSNKWKHASKWRRIPILFRTFFESFLMFSIYLFGGSVEYHREATLSQKILMFGFSLVILVAVVSYTANLTAFLTISSVVNFPSTMEEAIRMKKTICAVSALSEQLNTIYPQASFYFSDFDSTMRDDYINGLCDVFVLSTFDAQYSKENMEFLCDNNLVTTGSIAMQTSVAFPVQKYYVAGLSYWLKEAADQDVTFSDFAKMVKPARPATCPFTVSLGDNNLDDLRKLGPQNLFLPILLCGLCIVIAIVTHLVTKFQPAKRFAKTTAVPTECGAKVTSSASVDNDRMEEQHDMHNIQHNSNISDIRDMFQNILMNQQEILEKVKHQ